MSAIAYEGNGTSGISLILVHGFPLDRRMWRAQLTGLGAVARVLAVDLPGFGASAVMPAQVLSMDDMADSVLAVADGLGLGRFVLCGLSMGGYVAFAAARRFRSRLAGLILCDTRADPDTEAGAAGRRADADRILAEGTGFFVAKMLPLLLGASTRAAQPALTAEVAGWLGDAPARSTAAALRGLALRSDARPDLPGLAGLPVLVVSGLEDVITPPAGMQALAAAIPGAELALVPGGHLAPREHPAEVNAVIGRFLARLEPGCVS